MKKLVRVEAAPGLFVETALVFVPALVVIGVLEAAGDGAFGHEGAGNALLLASSGLATAIPLLLFAAAARRVPLSTVGLLQYVNPLMQLSIGVFVYDEPMPPARLVGLRHRLARAGRVHRRQPPRRRTAPAGSAAEPVPAGALSATRAVRTANYRRVIRRPGAEAATPDEQRAARTARRRTTPGPHRPGWGAAVAHGNDGL